MKAFFTLMGFLFVLAVAPMNASPNAPLPAHEKQAGYFQVSHDMIQFGQVMIWNCKFSYGITVENHGPESVMRITSSEGYQFEVGYPHSSAYVDSLEIPVESVSGSFRLNIRHCPVTMDQTQGTINISAEGYESRTIQLSSQIIHQDPYLWASPDTIDFGGVVLNTCAEFWPSSIGIGVKGPESILRISGSNGYKFSISLSHPYDYVETLEIPIRNGDHFNLHVQFCPVSMDETQGIITLMAEGYETILLPAISQIVQQGYTVTLEANPPEALLLMGGEGTYAPGARVHIYAYTYPPQEPGPGEWFFYNWTEGGVVVFQECGISDYSFEIHGNRHLVANFVPDVPLFRFSGPPDFGEVPVGECKILEYGAGSEYCWSLAKSEPDPDSRYGPLKREPITIIAPEGFQVKLWDSPFSDTLFWGFDGNFAFGEIFYARFCPREEKEYNDHIRYLYPGSEPGLCPVKGRGIQTLPVLDLSLILEGPYTPDGQFLMERKAPVVPFHTFYLWPPGNPAPLWFYGGEEGFEDDFGFGFPQEQRENIIDWVLLEQYDAASYEEISQQTLIDRKPCLLMNDGRILDTYGRLPRVLPAITQNLFVAIYHLNHLGVISRGLQEENGKYIMDFTRPDAETARGLKQLGNDIWGAFAGDADGNGIIELRDKSIVIDYSMALDWAFPEFADFNLDGLVTEADLKLWEDNLEQLSAVPETRKFNYDGSPCPGYETITDERDGRVYHSVLIGSQCWLVENARYLPQINSSATLPGNQPAYYVYGYQGSDLQEAAASEYYQGYGSLYNWMAALDACPEGWHLPDEAAWAQMAEYLNENYSVADEAGDPRSLGNLLKSCRQQQTILGEGCKTELHPRWDQNQDFGMDDFRFSALPGGRIIPGEGAVQLGYNASWWTSSQASADQAAYTSLQGHQLLGLNQDQREEKSTAMNIRCIRLMDSTAMLYQLDVEVFPPMGGSISGSGEYPANRTLLLRAVPAEGYEFINWNAQDQIISNDPYLVYVMPEADVRLQAWFVQATGIPITDKTKVLIYPVPAQQLLWVEFDNPGQTTLTLYNIQGQELQQQLLATPGYSKTSFRIDQLPPGIYLLMLADKETRSIHRVVVD